MGGFGGIVEIDAINIVRVGFVISVFDRDYDFKTMIILACGQCSKGGINIRSGCIGCDCSNQGAGSSRTISKDLDRD